MHHLPFIVLLAALAMVLTYVLMPGSGLSIRRFGRRGGQMQKMSFDGMPEYLPYGFTIDWTTVTPAPADTTLPDDTDVKAGDLYILGGTIMYFAIGGDGLRGLAAAATDVVPAGGLVRDRCFILSETIFESDGPLTDTPGGGIIGGKIWRARLRAGGAAQPTVAAVQAAMPRLVLVDD